MVITYTPSQLILIGRQYAINEALALCKKASQTSSQDQISNCLSLSVAEFFQRGQINFHPQTVIDPTKVRRLSEVEAEIVNSTTASS